MLSVWSKTCLPVDAHQGRFTKFCSGTNNSPFIVCIKSSPTLDPEPGQISAVPTVDWPEPTADSELWNAEVHTQSWVTELDRIGLVPSHPIFRWLSPAPSTSSTVKDIQFIGLISTCLPSDPRLLQWFCSAAWIHFPVISSILDPLAPPQASKSLTPPQPPNPLTLPCLSVPSALPSVRLRWNPSSFRLHLCPPLLCFHLGLRVSSSISIIWLHYDHHCPHSHPLRPSPVGQTSTSVTPTSRSTFGVILALRFFISTLLSTATGSTSVSRLSGSTRSLHQGSTKVPSSIGSTVHHPSCLWVVLVSLL